MESAAPLLPIHALSKIVATIGPASDSPEIVQRLIEAGVGIFRFNFSHGDFAAHEKRLNVVREVAAEMDRPIACLGDLQGPKIRVGKVNAPGMVLEPGQDVIFRKGLEVATIERPDPNKPGVVILPTVYEPLIDEVQPGQKVLINDGAIRMLAVDRMPERGELLCRVVVGGLVTSNKGINLPQSELSAPAITAKDWDCVAWAVEHAMDFLALSFVRKADEVLELKARLAELCPTDRRIDLKHETASTPVIAKIEMPQALKNLDEIVQAADGIMVARGDLGVEMDIAQVPVAQKRIIAMCAKWGKPCIVATQMLETMIENVIPTRAEASDVANAIFDGADAVMLSAETASGKHPVIVVETMRRIISVAEDRISEDPPTPSAPIELIKSKYSTAALAHGAWHIAQDVGAKSIVCWSENGGTARYLSQNDFRVPIIAYSSSVRATRRMCLLKGVTPVHRSPPKSGMLAEWNAQVDTDLVSRGIAKKGDTILLLAGKPLGDAKVTNTVAIHYVGDETRGFRAQGR
jgi:pyruvate kinase